jgi:hypothetical protein
VDPTEQVTLAAPFLNYNNRFDPRVLFFQCYTLMFRIFYDTKSIFLVAVFSAEVSYTYH